MTTFATAIFLMTLGALLLGVKDFSGILRGAIADVGNEHRLGSHEAPPAILSVYLGSYLTEILDHIEGIKKLSSKEMQYINHGLEVMPTVVKDASDRNRTSPIAYTGDKFEFRSVGSNANGARAASGMNVICAYGFKEILDRVQEKKGNAKERCILVLKDILKETKSVRFEGDNYSDNWKKEAKKRGLYIQDHTSDSLAFFSTPDCVALYESMNVLSKRELDSRTEITLDNYANLKAIEFKVGVTMIRTAILPAITKQLSQLGDAYMACQAADIESPSLKQEIKLMEGLYKTIHDQTDTFQKELKKIEALEDTYKRASALDKKATPLFQSIRSCVDEAEKEIDMDIWPFPSYDELLSVK